MVKLFLPLLYSRSSTLPISIDTCFSGFDVDYFIFLTSLDKLLRSFQFLLRAIYAISKRGNFFPDVFFGA